MSKVAGTVALITGGSSGIGLVSAQRFVAEGAAVFISSPRLNVWRAIHGPIESSSLALCVSRSTQPNGERSQ